MKKRLNFASIKSIIDYPDFLDIQIKSFKKFFQINTSIEKKSEELLYKSFMENFPISDSKDNFILEFIDYNIGFPKYLFEECLDLSVTYSVPLKVKLKLFRNFEEEEEFETIDQEVFLGNIPYMTPRGSFIINGIERVIVSQLHRSPGVFFTQTKHTNGTKLYSSRIIPFKGAWIEFATDMNNVMYSYIDRKKKFPITTLLRAIGYGSDKNILDIFNLSEEVKANYSELKKKIGRKLAARVLRTWTEDFIDEDTGEIISIDRNEVLLERDSILTEESIKIILDLNIYSIILHRIDINITDYNVIYNTFQKDNSNSEKEAVEQIYKQLRNTESPDEQTARDTIQSLFFSNKRYDLGEVGRYKINKKLGINIESDIRVLTKQDIIEIIKYLIGLINSKSVVDDIDHLSNRRVRTVGEQFYNQFSIGLSRISRAIKEKMNIIDNEDFKPSELINSRILSSVINSFFGTSPLSQFMDQVNPLAELTHKRRISSLGPGGLSRERAGFEVRDVHHTHYGRLCTIETPEGPNIGLISSLCIHARINNMGFIETPYKKISRNKESIIKNILYLTAEEEDSYNIAQSNILLDKNNKFLNLKIKSRFEGDFPLIDSSHISYMDIAPNQITSIAASLIPFLEHDDANRALMGSNMQRQAVPLINPKSPIVGTGLEKRIIKDFRGIIFSSKIGFIDYVDSTKILVKYKLSKKILITSFNKNIIQHNLTKFKGTNQETCINLKPIVSKNDFINKGQILCDGYATEKGELALGRNLKVAFMLWRGYNFEDAIVISEKVIKEDIFTSIHIEKFQLEIRNTKKEEEELTSEIPNINDDLIKNLDKNGIIQIGSTVKEGDIIIGKITSKGEIDPTPEEKLLKAIFGDKAGNVKDTSLRCPPSLNGVVIDVKLFSKFKKDKYSKIKLKNSFNLLKKKYNKLLLCLYNKMLIKISYILNGKISLGIYNNFGNKIFQNNILFTFNSIKNILFFKKNNFKNTNNHNIFDNFNFTKNIVLYNWIYDNNNNNLRILLKSYINIRNKIISNFKREKFSIEVGDELSAGIIKLAKVYIAKKKKLKVGDKMSGRHGNKGVIAKIVKEEDMPFSDDGTSIDIILNAIGVPARMNLGQIYETILGLAGFKLRKKYATPIFDGASINDVSRELKNANLFELGKVNLYDGLTGIKFKKKITIGIIYMLKLSHVVDDKIHARSIGPYSLITQQPLGGKSQFGGQRFGEMEVWSLEAFGAAYLLREILTIKSDDIVGRAKAYEAIVKGKNIETPNIPESFNVLIHELRGLGLEITLN